jgi:hypothetical protein
VIGIESSGKCRRIEKKLPFDEKSDGSQTHDRCLIRKLEEDLSIDTTVNEDQIAFVPCHSPDQLQDANISQIS